MFYDQPNDKKLVNKCQQWPPVGYPLTVFISGPYSGGDQIQNVRCAVEAGDCAMALGIMPFVPHLSAFWDLIYKHDYQTWIDYDNVWLMRSDCVWRLPGESKGADEEVKLAGRLGIPVVYDLVGLKEWVEDHNEDLS